MNEQALQARLVEKFGDAVSALVGDNTKDPFVRVVADRWLEVARFLKADPELGFDFLQNVTAVDWVKQDKLEVVYHLWSYPKRHGLVVKVELPRDKPQVSSVAAVWKAADWNEREQYDLLGVEFLAHPDLRRIMMPDDWPGHPMRKDYKEAEAYRGMPTTRPNTLDLLPMFDKAPSDQKLPNGGAGQ